MCLTQRGNERCIKQMDYTDSGMGCLKKINGLFEPGKIMHYPGFG